MKKEDWRTARAGVKKFRAGNYNRELTCRYAVENKDGQQHVFYQDYCHAGLRSANHLKKEWGENYHPVAILNLLPIPRAGEDAARRFYEWLFNFSPFSKVFVTKSVKQAMRENVIVASPEQPGDMLAGGLIASRIVSENHDGNGNYRNGWLWDQLVQRGVHPSVAFPVAHIIKPNYDYSEVAIDNIHHGTLTKWDDDLTEIDKRTWKLVENKPTLSVTQSWAEVPQYSNITGTWYDKLEKRKDCSVALQNAIRAVQKMGVKKNNPFDVAPLGVQQVKCNEFLEEVAPNLRKLTHKEMDIAA